MIDLKLLPRATHRPHPLLTDQDSAWMLYFGKDDHDTEALVLRDSAVRLIWAYYWDNDRKFGYAIVRSIVQAEDLKYLADLTEATERLYRRAAEVPSRYPTVFDHLE